jgi:hypothetical protein
MRLNKDLSSENWLVWDTEAAKSREQIALDFDVFAHVRFAQCQRRRRQQFFFRNVFVNNNVEQRLAFANDVGLVVKLYRKAVFIEAT